MIDYEQINELITPEHIKTILNKLKIPFKENDKYLLMPTVCHNEDIETASWKLYYYYDSKIFMCYTNCSSMNIWKFLKNYYTVRNIDYDWYQDIYCLITQTANYNSNSYVSDVYKSNSENYKKRGKRILKTYPEGILDIFTKFYPIEWLNDSISKEAMDKYNIRYSISQNKIIIPHYDVNNRLIGIRGRALNPQEVENFGKYAPVQIEGRWYSHPLSLNLYGLNLNKENIKKTGICYVFESEKSTMQCESFSGVNCAVASCGSNLNKNQINLLLKYCTPREIIVCYDKEELPNEDKYFSKLYNICKKYSPYCDMSFIYDREGLLKLKDSPSDNGEEVFKKLVERRIQVR